MSLTPGEPCSSTPEVPETSLTTVNPQGYSVLSYMHMSSLLGSGLAEKGRVFHSSLFLLSHLRNHFAQSRLLANSLIRYFHKYLLSSYYVPGSVLDTEDT